MSDSRVRAAALGRVATLVGLGGLSFLAGGVAFLGRILECCFNRMFGRVCL